MPYAFGHLTGCWIFAKIYERLKHTLFSHMEWGILLFGAILPDIDLLLDWTFDTAIHRWATHSLFFAIIIGLLTYSFFRIIKPFAKKVKPMSYGFCISFGILTHLVLDMALGSPGIQLFWPSHYGVWLFGMAPYPTNTFFDHDLRPLLSFAIFDMAIGTAWIGYLWMRKRITL